MKCVKRADGTGSVRRVSNTLAQHLVKTENYVYCPKVEWKESGRVKQS